MVLQFHLKSSQRTVMQAAVSRAPIITFVFIITSWHHMLIIMVAYVYVCMYVHMLPLWYIDCKLYTNVKSISEFQD